MFRITKDPKHFGALLNIL